MRSEWAAEQHDATADAQEQWQRGQTFRDWLIAARDMRPKGSRSSDGDDEEDDGDE